VTVFMDMTPEVSLARKHADRDRFERDMPLLGRVRHSYQRQAQAAGWITVNAAREKDAVAADVISAVRSRLGLL
jgi:thymidylate kinase